MADFDDFDTEAVDARPETRLNGFRVLSQRTRRRDDLDYISFEVSECGCSGRAVPTTILSRVEGIHICDILPTSERRSQTEIEVRLAFALNPCGTVTTPGQVESEDDGARYTVREWWLAEPDHEDTRRGIREAFTSYAAQHPRIHGSYELRILSELDPTCQGIDVVGMAYVVRGAVSQPGWDPGPGRYGIKHNDPKSPGEVRALPFAGPVLVPREEQVIRGGARELRRAVPCGM
jgi:hypothetical protein